MQFKEFEQAAKEELEQDLADVAKRHLKARLKEIRQAKRTLERLEAHYAALLEKDVDEFIDHMDV